MRRRVIVRSSAHRDVIAQAEYFGQQADDALAYRFFEACEATFRWLLKNPNVGKPSRIAELKLEGVREFPVKDFDKHIIFYRPLDNGIEILRVLHGSRDIETILKSE